VDETLRECATFDGLFAGSVGVRSRQYCSYKRPLGLRIEWSSQIKARDDIGAFTVQFGEG
jgi:hypothetical protein